MEAFNWASSAEMKMTELEKTIIDADAVHVNGTNSVTGKVRRRRTVYSRAHLELLLKTFETNPYPGISVREKLSHLTGVHESRIQVWFQNRRARKNKKVTQEEENLPHNMEWPKFNPIPQVGQVAQPERKHFGVAYSEKSEEVYKNCAFPLQTRNHLHMNNLAGSQPLGYMRPNQYQPTNVTTPSLFLNPLGITQPQLYPYMKPQLLPSSNLPYVASPLEVHGLEYTSTCAMTSAPNQDAFQEFSLQDILEEFQPCWTEVANNSIGVNEGPLF